MRQHRAYGHSVHRHHLQETRIPFSDNPTLGRRRHEVLVRSGKFSIETRQAEGIKGQDIIVCDAFVCIPASFDHAVGWSLGVKAIRADSSERRA